MCIPNYRGSLGYGAQFAECLIGHASEYDVQDCAALTRKALETYPQIDPSRVAVFGGSHGGFLAGVWG